MNLLARSFFLGFDVDSNHDLVLSDPAKKDFTLIPVPKDVNYILKISSACVRVRKEILEPAKIPIEIEKMDDESIISKISQSSLSAKYPGIFCLCQAVLAEVFTINYILAGDQTYLEDMSDNDIQCLRKNFDYLSWWFSYFREYRFLVQYFRKLDLAIGYIDTSNPAKSPVPSPVVPEEAKSE